MWIYAPYQPHMVVNSLFFNAENSVVMVFFALKPYGKVE